VAANNDTLASRVTVFDVSEPHRPTIAAALDLASDARGLALGTGCLLVPSHHGFSGLSVVDIAQTGAPRLAARVRLGASTAIAASRDRAYLVSDNRIAVVDIQDPHNPVAVGEHRPVGYLRDLAVRDRILYVASEYAGLQILRIE
jgi:hypothetical protein